MQDQINILKQLGLNENEAKFYLAALELGPATILKLSKKTGLQRSSIYEFMDDLIEKGVIETVISGKRKLYKGTEPEKLKQLLRRQEELLDSIIPELSALMGKGVQRPKIMLFEGTEGIKKVYEDLLDQPEGSEFVAFTSIGDIMSVISETYAASFLSRRAKRNISVKVIVKTDELSKEYISRNKAELRETKAVRAKDFPLSNEINIYQNKVGILSFGDEKIGVIIESSQIANSMRAIFNLLWANLKS